MTRWAPAKKDTLDALAAEILHNYPVGFARVAIAADDADTATRFARELRDSFEAVGREATAVRIDDDSIPARSAGGPMFLVTGAVAGDPAFAGHWNYRVWLDTGLQEHRATRAAASAIVDVTDPDHPRRVFADSC